MKLKNAMLLFPFFLTISCTSKENEGVNKEPDMTEQKTEATTEMPEKQTKTTVFYFSCTNTTEGVAKKIAGSLNVTERRIIPAVAYTEEDLNYQDSDCRANREQNDYAARPEIKGRFDLRGFETVFLGYPIWLEKAPRIIFTFLESYDFGGKTLVPFCTSGSTSITASVTEIRAAKPEVSVLDGRRFSASVSQAEIDDWVKHIVMKGDNQ